MGRTLASAAVACLALASACAGTETGNGQKPREKVTQVVLKLSDGREGAPATYAAVDADGEPVVIDAAWVHIDELAFHFADGVSCTSVFDPAAFVVEGGALAGAACDDDDDRLRIEGPFVVDLMTGHAEPSLDAVPLPPGTYRHAEAMLTRAKGDLPPLGGETLVAHGALGSGEDARPFRLALGFTAFATFDGELAVEAETGGHAHLLFDVRGWFGALPLSACADAGSFEADPDGTLVLRDGGQGCPHVEQALRDAIRAATRLADRTE